MPSLDGLHYAVWLTPDRPWFALYNQYLKPRRREVRALDAML